MLVRGFALGLSVLMLGAGCRGKGPAGEVERLREAPGPPIYYLGDSFESYQLTHVEAAQGKALFIYGSCEIHDPDGPFGPEGGSCVPPIEIQQAPLGSRPGRLDIPCRKLTLRGVPAQHADGLFLYTATAVVHVYGTSRAQELRIAQSLRPVRGDGRPGGPLPQPPAHIVRGLSCG